MNAAVLTIGDELLQGFTVDTNSSWLGTILLTYNIRITKKITVGDKLNDIISEIHTSLSSLTSSGENTGKHQSSRTAFPPPAKINHGHRPGELAAA